MKNVFNGKHFFIGDYHQGDSYRKNYLDSIQNYIEKQFECAYRNREIFMPPEKLKQNPDLYRRQYINMIGMPVENYPQDTPQFKISKFAEDDFGSMYRMQIEVLPNIFFYGILSLPQNAMNLPLVIAQHGGGGIPEFCCDSCGENAYDHFSKRALENRFAVFAPQLLLWDFNVKTGELFPKVPLDFERSNLDVKLKQLGLSITGFEVFCIRRSIDCLSSFSEIDKNRIGMMGLSYGGYFSLYTAAADVRIKAIYAAGFFNDRTNIGFSDWKYKNSANTFHDAEVAGLCAPRRLIIDVGKIDPVFDYQFSIEEAKRIEKYYQVYHKKEQFTYNLWEGGHRFDAPQNLFQEFFKAI